MAAIPVDPREELERLERKHAENPEGRYFVPLADAYRRAGDLSGAIDLLRAGLARHPDYLSAHVVLGRCYADSGDPDAAEAEFRYILSLDPQNLIALRTLGDSARAHGRLREAERWYQDLVAVDPMNDDARSALRQLLAEEPIPAVGAEGQAGMMEIGIANPAGDAPGGEPEGYEGDAGLGDMVDLRSDDGRGALFDDDSDAVVTETIAELYTRQGFHDRAADVYRELIRRRGGDDALEAKLRRAESLASGVPAEDVVPAPASDSPPEGPANVDLDGRSTEPAHRLEPGVHPAPDEGLGTSTPDDSLYPLIGPVDDLGAGGLHGPASEEELEPQVPPAYDFAIPVEDRTGSDAGSEDLNDLLIDPYADPFGSESSASSMDLSARSFGAAGSRPGGGSDDVPRGGGFRPDPFADSFAEGFPALDAEPSTDDRAASASVSLREEEDSASAPPSGGMPIGAFLRSVATWSRSGVKSETAPAPAPSATASIPAPGGLDRPGDYDPRPHPTSSVPEPELAASEDAPAPGPSTADIELDAAPGSPAVGVGGTSSDASASAPAKPSGADDLQLVTGVDDLFPWEIPVPDHGAQTLPPVQSLDLDPGYPFDDTPRAEAPFVDETAHSERSPSEAVEPSAPEAGEQGVDPPALDVEAAPVDVEAPRPTGDDALGEPPPPPVETGDDDDLESFQAWLRSLKR